MSAVPFLETVCQLQSEEWSVANDLLASGLATPYGGGTKVSWCS